MGEHTDRHVGTRLFLYGCRSTVRSPTVRSRQFQQGVGLVFGLSRSGSVVFSIRGFTMFFSNPISSTIVTESYRGADGKNYEALGRDTCTIFSLCDTYRTAYPLYTLLQTECAPDPVNTMLEFIPNKAFGATPEYCSVEC